MEGKRPNHGCAHLCAGLLVCLGLGMWTPLLQAEERQAELCAPGDTGEALQYLRRLSLDIRGHLPSMEELSSVASNKEVDPAIIRQMLRSDGFLSTMRSFHRDLLWVNVKNQALTNNDFRIQRQFTENDSNPNQNSPSFTISFQRRQTWRSGGAACLDEPARFDPSSGEILTTFDSQTGAHREGWVEVEPYWAPGTRIKVCAFEAQASLRGVNDRGREVECWQREAVRAKACGCGPNLRWCESRNDFTRETILSAFNEQVHRFVEQIVRQERPYSDLLLGKHIEVNGPLSHYYRHLSRSGYRVFDSSPIQNHPIPEISFEHKEQWETVTRELRHSGVLTLPAFLTKFPTGRSRANRFYNAFLCRSFEAPEGGLPASEDECQNEPDLSKRCGCKYCHAGLEPAAAYWGRWAENGVRAMNESEFPIRDQNCVNEARLGRSSERCRLYYLSEAQHPSEQAFVGYLKPYVFADEDRQVRIEKGPEEIVTEAIESGAFARCTARNLWAFLVDASITLEDPILDPFATSFGSDYDLFAILERILRDERYIKAGRF